MQIYVLIPLLKCIFLNLTILVILVHSFSPLCQMNASNALGKGSSKAVLSFVKYLFP